MVRRYETLLLGAARGEMPKCNALPQDTRDSGSAA
jgi:hypothetical protein